MGRIPKSSLVAALAQAEEQIEHGDPSRIEEQIRQKRSRAKGIDHEIEDLRSQQDALYDEMRELKERLEDEDAALLDGEARSLERQRTRYRRYLDDHYPDWRTPKASA